MLKTLLRRLAEAGDFQIGGLAGRFTETSREIAGIVATANTRSRQLCPSRCVPIRAATALTFATLKDPPAKNAFVILDAGTLETFSVWLRLVSACTVSALYRRGGEGLRTVFMLSEFAGLDTSSRS
jgi:hypothetical protein